MIVCNAKLSFFEHQNRSAASMQGLQWTVGKNSNNNQSS